MSKTITKHTTEISERTIEQIESHTSVENQVIVHCLYNNVNPTPMSIRIWPSTILIDHDSNHKSILLHIENITSFPFWKTIPAGDKLRFTLVFTGLPKGCQIFDLVEVIPESGGFEVPNIRRNKTDVYHVNLT